MSQRRIPSRLVELLRTASPKVQTPVLRTVGNIVTGSDEQTQCMIDAGALGAVMGLLSHAKKTIRKEAAWTISNITAGNQSQIAQVIQAGAVRPLVQRLENDEFDVKKEAAWSLSNACSGGSPAHIAAMVQQGVIKALAGLFTSHEPRTVMVALDGIEAILRAGANNTDDDNVYADELEECQGLDALENLQNHDSTEIYEKAASILSAFYLDEEEDDTAATAPVLASNAQQFSFGITQPTFTGGAPQGQQQTFNFA